MATDAEIEEAVDDLSETVADIADDTERWSQDESAQVFEGVAEACRMRAAAIRSEIAGGG